MDPHALVCDVEHGVQKNKVCRGELRAGMVVAMEADRKAIGVLQDTPRYGGRSPPEVVGNERYTRMETVLLYKTEQRPEIQEAVVSPKRWIVDYNRRVLFARLPTPFPKNIP
jgi:hypothetical protein